MRQIMKNISPFNNRTEMQVEFGKSAAENCGLKKSIISANDSGMKAEE